MQNLRAKRTITGLNSLKNMGLTSRAEIKFILDSSPFEDEDNLPSPTNDWLIIGRLLLNSPIYKDGAIKLHIIIGQDFPRDPPIVYLKTMVFHPNVTKEGEFCIEVIKKDGRWTPVSTLDTVVLQIAQAFDNPSTDRIQYTEAANMWDMNRAEYERRARETFMKNCSPRT